jgi:hypothetical protein
MAVTLKNYIVLYSEGNQLDLAEVNQKAAEGWELLQFFVAKGEKRAQARFAYVMQRSAGQTETDVLVGTFTVGTSANTIIINSHGLPNGALVRFALGPETGNVLPAPLQSGVYYYVVNTRGNDFQVSLISGGAAIDITTSGTGSTNQVWKK